ncbi:MAG: OmpH family outer membrane protein [Verrucomicrobiota bacterium]
MKLLSTLLLLLSFTLLGCDRSSFSGPKGGVALVDLDDVAKRLGRDVAIVQELKDAGGPLSDQLTAAQKEYQTQFDKTKDTIGARPSDADAQKLADLARNLNAQLQQKQQQAQQELNTKRASLVTRFREELKPVALKIASRKGLGTVLVKSEMVVLGNEPGLDITDEVVAEMIRTGAPTPTATPSKPL